MAPNRIRKALHRRLAYLEAELGREDLPSRLRAFHEDEAGALWAVLEKCGLLEEARLDRYHKEVVARVLPMMAKRREQNRRARELATIPPPPPSSARVLEQFDTLTRAVRVA